MTKPHAYLSSCKSSWLGVSSGIRGLGFNYVVFEYEYGAELYIDRRVLGDGAEAENRKIFDQLYSQRQKVETAVGGPIEWETFEGKRVCRIRIREDGGWKSPEESWPEIQDQIIKTMDRFELGLATN